MKNRAQTPHVLPDDFLAKLVADLNNETVRAIILRGSYARGDAVAPYSDVDITLIIHEAAGYNLPKRFFWRDGYLVSVSRHSYAAYRERLTKPEQAIFVVTGVREAHILLDKDGEFRAFQQEAWAFRWQDVQQAANIYAGQKLMLLSESILRTMRMLQFQDTVLLAKVILDILFDITEAVAVQRGLLLEGQNYWHRVYESIGDHSAWAHYHMRAAGSNTGASLSLRERGIAALRAYQETCKLLQSSLRSDHMEAIEPLIALIDQALGPEEIG
ncbi:MAG TPA: nucleotidyltransferase domain-containing protein [Ktedonobacteraceae bacterium]|nr:nucleotidyltransferase domain-containing protein [Ktedonobacteraceae bacterium]